jgi:hypothetical protein
MPEELYRSDSFVVRIWWEDQDDMRPTWRGWAQHAASGESRYFDQMTDLLAFIDDLAGPLQGKENQGGKRM